MSQRIPSAITILLLLFVLGCGQAHRSVAPDVDADGSVTDPTSLVKLDAAGGAFDSDDDDDDREKRDRSAPARAIKGPTTITKSGNYRLVSDFRTSTGDGIVIKADDVRLWLGDHRLRGPGNKTGRAIVIDGARNVSVYGGRVERFGVGVVVSASSECRVRGVDIRGGDEPADPPNGNPPQIGILLVNSSRNYISRNHLRRINLGIFVRGGASYENVIRNNEVVAGMHGLLAICYNPASGAGPGGPNDDRVTRNVLNRFGVGIQTSAGSANNSFRYNTIRYFTAAYEDLNGTNVFTRNRSQQIAP